jgi:hypothetical protein
VSAWLVVWLVIGLVTLAAIAAFAVFLVRHVMILGRTAGRMQDELAPLAQEISRESARASDRAGNLRMPPPTKRRRGRR